MSSRPPHRSASSKASADSRTPRSGESSPQPRPLDHEREFQLSELREELVEERAQIIGAQHRATPQRSAAMRAPAEPGGGPLTPADLARGADRTRLEAIETALESFAQGTYGDCIRCGSPIAMTQLRAHVDAECCEPCASQARTKR
jgi:RNA polymerase-binding transcription factor DksA